MLRTYHWAIATKQIRQRKASAFRLVMALTVVTLLVCTAVTTIYHLRQLRMERESAITISLFLKPTVDAMAASDIASDLRHESLISSVDLRSPDSARVYFNDKYGINIGEVLPQNPFPYSLILHLRPGHLNGDSFVALVQHCRSMNTVVDDVAYQTDAVRSVLNEAQSQFWMVVIAAAVLGMTVLCLLWFALRAEGSYVHDDVRVLILMGAKRSFLARSALWRNLLCCVPATLAAGGVCVATVAIMSPTLFLSAGNDLLALNLLSGLGVIFVVALLSRLSLPTAKKW